MRHLTLLLAATVLLGGALDASALTYTYALNEDKDGNPYLPTDDVTGVIGLWTTVANWSGGVVPTTDDTVRIGYGTAPSNTTGYHLLIDTGVTAEGSGFDVPYTAPVTIEVKGSVNVLGNWYIPDGSGASGSLVDVNGGTVTAATIRVGKGGAATLKVRNGGVVTGTTYVENDRGSTILLEGGTIISGGNLNMDQGNDGLLEIGPGSTLTVDGYVNAEWGGYVIRVRGGGSDINLSGRLRFGVFGIGNAMRYELVLDASGLSTINADSLQLDDTKLPELEFSGSGAPDTYTILHTNSDPTGELGEFASVAFGAGFSNLRVVDLTATTGGYDVRVDYIPEPATMLLLCVGGLGVLVRRKRR